MNILLAGRLDFGPIARHLRAFIETLSANPDNEIYIDSYYIDLFRADFFGTNELLQHYLELDNVHLASHEMQYDTGIFTDLLTLQYNDTYYREFLKRNCKLRICYEVFDGSIPPLDWIEIINNDFDICCAPSVYIRDCLVKYGVKIPCFNLPCVVFNDALLSMSPRKKDFLRFGFVGGAEQRKNLLKVIEAFHKAFKNNKQVELYIHSAYSPEEDYINVCQYLVNEYSKYNKISFHLRKPVGTEEMYDLISSFDFYIFPTKITGYFTTPCEALSIGIPIIISDIPVHQELAKDLSQDDGVFFIRADEVDVMIHSYLGDKCLGVQFDMSVDEIARQMTIAYSLRDRLFSEEKIEKRKSVARQYSLENLSGLFQTLVNPENFSLSRNNAICGNTVFCTERSLFYKYKSINKNLILTEHNFDQTFRYHIHKEDYIEIIESVCKKIEMSRMKRLFYLNNNIVSDPFLESRYSRKIRSKAKKYHIREFPFFAYKLMSFYFKIKSFFTRK